MAESAVPPTISIDMDASRNGDSHSLIEGSRTKQRRSSKSNDATSLSNNNTTQQNIPLVPERTSLATEEPLVYVPKRG